MASQQEKFIENLKSFSTALENITELLEQQQKAGSADVLVDLVSRFDEKLTLIAENLQTVVEKTTAIDTKADKILKVTEEIKKGKEGGIFEKAYDKKAKTKIMDGVKTIVLIAGAVLAIGLAFKIVGRVDFASVMSLSLAMVVVAYAMKQIAEIKNLTLKSTILAGLLIVTMAAAVFAAAWILQFTPTISLYQGLTILLVSAAIGVAAFLIFKAIENIDLAKNWSTILMLPLALPLIAAGIVGASFILSLVQPLSLDQILAVIGVSAALIPAAIATFFIGQAMRGMSWKEILMVTLVFPIVSLGILASSYILSAVKPIEDPGSLIISSLAMGVSILAFVPAMYILGKMQPMQLLMGGLGVLIVAVAIMATSWILSIGNYENYPPLGWTLSVGLSMLLFAPAIFVLGAIGMTGIGLAILAVGAIAVLLVAGTIVATAAILGMGNYTKFPPLEWSTSVGLSMTAYAMSMLLIGSFILFTFGLGYGAMEDAAGMMKIVAQSIVDSASILGKGVYKGGPTKEWSEGIGDAIGGFSEAFATMSDMGGLFSSWSADEYSEAVKTIAGGLVGAAQTLNKMGAGFNWSTATHPTKEWAEGVGGAIGGFAEAFKVINESDSGGLAGWLGLKQKMTPEEFAGAIKVIAGGLIGAAQTLNASNVNWSTSKYPSKEWAEGVGDSISSFSTAIKNLSEEFDEDLTEPIDLMTVSMIKLQMLFMYIDIQKKMYDKNGIIYTFGDAIRYLVASFPTESAVSPLEKFIDALKEVDDISFTSVFTVNLLANAIEDLGDTLADIDTSNIEKLLKISTGFKMISLIDNIKLNEAIRTINERKEDIAEIFDDKTLLFNLDDYISNTTGRGTSETTTVSKTATTNVEDKDMKDLIEYVKNIDTNIEKISKLEANNPLNKPENVNTVSKFLSGK